MITLDNDERLRTAYKRIKIYTDEGVDSPRFQKSVSFNTVPTVRMDSTYDSTDTEFQGVIVPRDPSVNEVFTPNDINLLLRLNNSESFFRNQGFRTHREPGTLVPFKEIFQMTPSGKVIRRDYPSQPSITDEAFLVNKVHQDWNKTWTSRKHVLKERLLGDGGNFRYSDIILKNYYTNDNESMTEEMETRYRYNEQRGKNDIFDLTFNNPCEPRTIICHIDGRKHTWVALDWLIQKFLNNTDHIIVVTNLPRIIDRSNKYNSNHNNKTKWSTGYDMTCITYLIEDIFRYIETLLPPEKIVKVTIEVTIGKTFKILQDVINIYQPDLIVSSTLKWDRSENLITYKSKLLNDKLIIKYPIPLCIVPAKRLYQFELNLQEKFCFDESIDDELEFQNSDICSLESLIRSCSHLVVESENEIDDELDSDLDLSSDIRSESINSENEDIYDSVETPEDIVDKGTNAELKIHDIVKSYRMLMKNELTLIEEDTSLCSSTKKLQKIDKIITSSLTFSINVDNNLVIDTVHYNKLKTVLTGGTTCSSLNQKPMIDIAANIDHNNQIKFAADVKRKDGYKSLGNHRRNKSVDDDKISEGRLIHPPLRKVQSTGGLRKQESNESAKSSYSSRSAGYDIQPESSSKNSKSVFSFLKTATSTSKCSSRRNSNSSDQNVTSGGSGKTNSRVSRIFGLGKH